MRQELNPLTTRGLIFVAPPIKTKLWVVFAPTSEAIYQLCRGHRTPINISSVNRRSAISKTVKNFFVGQKLSNLGPFFNSLVSSVFTWNLCPL